jgi:catechol 2,3-dioxygenase-like lactoylglutathione lyase family enzyme
MGKSAPSLNQINIVARDFEASVAFYRRLGLEIPDRPDAGLSIRHAEVKLQNGFSLAFDNDKLAGTYNAAWRRSEGSARAVIGFSVSTREDVDRMYTELTGAGYQGRQKPYDAFWGARYAIVADPDGNDVGLMSPIDEHRQTWPPVDSPQT